MCIRLSKNNSNVHFNYTTCLTNIITQTTMTNRPEEPHSWAVIDNLDCILLLAAIALSFLESYGQNLKAVQAEKWEHQWLDWNDHVTKLLHEHRFHHEYRMSLQAFNHVLQLLKPSITAVDAVKSNTSSSSYSTNQHIYPKLILAISLFWLVCMRKPIRHSSCLWSFLSISLWDH